MEQACHDHGIAAVVSGAGDHQNRTVRADAETGCPFRSRGPCVLHESFAGMRRLKRAQARIEQDGSGRTHAQFSAVASWRR